MIGEILSKSLGSKEKINNIQLQFLLFVETRVSIIAAICLETEVLHSAKVMHSAIMRVVTSATEMTNFMLLGEAAFRFLDTLSSSDASESLRMIIDFKKKVR